VKTIILAAGIGKRLYPLTKAKPKCLIEIGNKTLIERTLDALRENGMKTAVIVVGHLQELVKSTLGDSYKGINIKYIANPFYQKTGSMHSLLLAKDELDDDFIFMDADLLCHQDILKRIINSKYANAILFGPLETDTGEEVKVYTNNSIMTYIGKKVQTKDKCLGEAVGIVKYSKATIPVLIATMEELFARNPSAEHEDLTQLMCAKKIMYPVSTDNLPWKEIDFVEDVETAKTKVLEAIENA